MTKYESKKRKHCRWCGTGYYAFCPPNGDGFCSARCRQAHYRAYKNYVTQKRYQQQPGSAQRITEKKQ